MKWRRSSEKLGQTLQPTALLHKAWLRWVNDESPRWDSRGHFFSAAAEAMRRILVEQARRKGRLKHGGHLQRTDLATSDLANPARSEENLFHFLLPTAHGLKLTLIRNMGMNKEHGHESALHPITTERALPATSRHRLPTHRFKCIILFINKHAKGSSRG